jgi:hypothetical protein
MAAVLACGEGAVVSHLSAAALWLHGCHARGVDSADVTVCCRTAAAVRACGCTEAGNSSRRTVAIPRRTCHDGGSYLLDLAGVVEAGELGRRWRERRGTSRRIRPR